VLVLWQTGERKTKTNRNNLARRRRWCNPDGWRREGRLSGPSVQRLQMPSTSKAHHLAPRLPLNQIEANICWGGEMRDLVGNCSRAHRARGRFTRSLSLSNSQRRMRFCNR
jgi:hypothetical protein